MNEPLVASVLSARFEAVWSVPLKPKDYGYNKLSTLLRALPHLCEVSIIPSANSASAPTLLVKLLVEHSQSTNLSSTSSVLTEVQETLKEQPLLVPQEEEWHGQKTFRGQAADLVAQAAGIAI